MSVPQVLTLGVVLALAALGALAARGVGGLPRGMRALEALDRRWIFLAMGLAVLLPLLHPIGLPVKPSAPVMAYYDKLESLPPGSIVLISADYDPASSAELQPMMVATLEQLFRRDIKVVMMELWPGGPPLAERALAQAASTYHKAYGVDYVHLGFKEGKIIVMVALGSAGFASQYPVDIHGTPVSRLPLMRRVTNYSSFGAIVSMSSGDPGTKEWVQQVQSRFNPNVGTGTTAGSAADYYAYLESHQLFGMLGGMAGAAEYEQLVGQRGTATAGMDAMSVAHAFVILAIVLGNIAYQARLAARRRGEEA